MLLATHYCIAYFTQNKRALRSGAVASDKTFPAKAAFLIFVIVRIVPE